MKNYKQVPGLWVNLFSITQAIADGWKLGNDKKVITISKGGTTIRFDKQFPSGDGYVCGVDITPVVESAATTLAEGTTIDINDFHKIFNHASEETLKYTAQETWHQAQGYSEALLCLQNGKRQETKSR